MQLDPSAIALINAGTVGAAGISPSEPNGAGTVPAVNGGDAPAVALAVSGDTYFDPSVSLDLTPLAKGGQGGFGTYGPSGQSPSPVLTGGSYVFPDAGSGGDGGAGGAGGNAELAFDNDQFGTAASPLGGGGTIQDSAAGGSGDNGDLAGGGGSAGFSGTGGPFYDDDAAGAAGSSGTGGAGGGGGGAVNAVDALTEAVDGAAVIDLSASGGAGGNGSYGPVGGSGFDPATGGNGGAGGAGGMATASLTDSTISSLASLSIALAATGGAGGTGGQGADGGVYEVRTYDMYGNFITRDDHYGTASAGAAGGAAGQAVVEITGDTLTAPDVILSSSPVAGLPGNGGAGGAAVASASVYNPDGLPEYINIFGAAAGAAGAAGQMPADPVQITMTGDTITASGTLSLALNTPAVDVPFNGNSGYDLTFSGNTFMGDGASELNLVGSAPGMTVNDLTGMIGLTGSADTSTISGFDSFVLAIGDQFDAPVGPQPNVVYLAPDPDTIVLTPGHGPLTIDGATSSNLILDFEGYASAGLSQITGDTGQDGSGDTVISVPGDGAVTVSQFDFVPAAGNTSIDVGTPLCFRAGTMIATEDGEIAVEELRPGDTVRTYDGDRATIVWLGRRHMNCARHPHQEQVWPIRVSAGAFAQYTPRRALFLSPNHAVFVLDRLIPIRHLVNGTTIAVVRVDEVTYHHVELARHDLLLAEGVAAESYLDTGDRADFTNSGAVMRLFPDFAVAGADHAWQANGCAPLTVTGPHLEAVRRHVDARAAAMERALVARSVG